MSLLGKKTFVEKVMESCTSDELLSVRSLMNSMDTESYVCVSLDPTSSNFISNSNKGVSYVSFQLSTLLSLNEKGILVYNTNYCALFTNNGTSKIVEYKINVANHTYERIYENLTAEEMRQVVNDLLVGIIARETIFNIVDLTTLGAFSVGPSIDMNSAEDEEVGVIGKKLFDTYSEDKVTMVKLSVKVSEDEDEDSVATVTASDTAIHMFMYDSDSETEFEIIQVFAANIYKAGLSTGGPSSNEGVYPELSFIKAPGLGTDGADLYLITVGVYNYDDIEEIVNDLNNDDVE